MKKNIALLISVLLVTSSNSSLGMKKLLRTFFGFKKKRVRRKKKRKEETLLEHSQNVLIRFYKDNQIDLFDTKTDNQINKKTIQAQEDKEIEKAKILNNRILYIRYTYPEYNRIDLFDIKTSNRVNKKTIQAREDKQIEAVKILNNRILYIRYTCPEYNRIDLFDIKTGNQINKKTIQAREDKQIEKVKILNNTILHIQYENNQIDLFAIKTGSRINKKYLQVQEAKMLNKAILYIQYENNRISLFSIKKGTSLFSIKKGSRINKKTIQAREDKQIEAVTILKTIPYIRIRYEDNKIDLFDIKTSERINKKTIQAQEGKQIRAVRTLNNAIIYIRYADNQINLFDIVTGNQISKKTIKIEDDQILVAQHSDGSFYLILTLAGEILYKNVQAFRVKQNRFIITKPENNRINIFDIKTKKRIFTAQIRKNFHLSDIQIMQNLILLIRCEDESTDLFHIPSKKKISSNKKTIRFFRVQKNHPILYIAYADSTLNIINTDTGDAISETALQLQPDKDIFNIQHTPGENHVLVLYKKTNQDQMKDFIYIDLFDIRKTKKINRTEIKTQNMLQLGSISNITLKSSRLIVKYKANTCRYFTKRFRKAADRLRSQFLAGAMIVYLETFNLETGKKTSGFKKATTREILKQGEEELENRKKIQKRKYVPFDKKTLLPPESPTPGDESVLRSFAKFRAHYKQRRNAPKHKKARPIAAAEESHRSRKKRILEATERRLASAKDRAKQDSDHLTCPFCNLLLKQKSDFLYHLSENPPCKKRFCNLTTLL